MSESTINVNVKIVGGEGCTISVSPDIPIANLKKLIENQLRIQIGVKKLLYKGKTLMDDKSLSDYKVTNEGILYIMRNKQDGTSSSSSSSPPQSNLHIEMKKYLARYLSESDAEKVAVEFMKEFNRGVSQYNLDDWERIATRNLKPSNAI